MQNIVDVISIWFTWGTVFICIVKMRKIESQNTWLYSVYAITIASIVTAFAIYYRYIIGGINAS